MIIQVARADSWVKVNFWKVLWLEEWLLWPKSRFRRVEVGIPKSREAFRIEKLSRIAEIVDSISSSV